MTVRPPAAFFFPFSGQFFLLPLHMVRLAEIAVCITALILYVLCDRFLFRRIFSRTDSLLQYVPPDLMSGSRGFFIAFAAAALIVLFFGLLYAFARHLMHRHGGRFSRLLDRD